ncbi:hypothetical protein QCA50_011363 [Cerrena zonata]|uniref:DUF6699 domain-containing protein n=1 Tax=Cerrena zonata TaxID=2478898 RepID=A0AAW0G1E7_9APHY
MLSQQTLLAGDITPTPCICKGTIIGTGGQSRIVINPVLDPDIYSPNGIPSKHVAWDMSTSSTCSDSDSDSSSDFGSGSGSGSSSGSDSLLSVAFRDQPISVSGHKLLRLYLICDEYPWDIMISTNTSARTITVGTLLFCMEKDMRRQVTDEEKQYIKKRLEKTVLDSTAIEERMRSIVIRRDIFEPGVRFGGLQNLNKNIKIRPNWIPVLKLVTIKPRL